MIVFFFGGGESYIIYTLERWTKKRQPHSFLRATLGLHSCYHVAMWRFLVMGWSFRIFLFHRTPSLKLIRNSLNIDGCCKMKLLVFPNIQRLKWLRYIPSLNHTVIVRSWKWMVGRLNVLLWPALFSEDMLVSWRVYNWRAKSKEII